MAIYVDNIKIKWRQKIWCHLVADSLDELHRFAKQIGMKREWFQSEASYPHYDVTIERREVAISLGAIIADRKTIISKAKKLKEEHCQQKEKMDYNQLSLF